jgi:hypothetical protein
MEEMAESFVLDMIRMSWEDSDVWNEGVMEMEKRRVKGA